MWMAAEAMRRLVGCYSQGGAKVWLIHGLALAAGCPDLEPGGYGANGPEEG